MKPGMNKTGKLQTNILLSVILAISLAMSALAHRAVPVSADSSMDASVGYAVAAKGYPTGTDLSQYRLPDGTLPDLCVGSGGEHHNHDESCDFCTLSHGSFAPDMELRLLETGRTECGKAVISAAQILSTFINPAHRGRAPPAYS